MSTITKPQLDTLLPADLTLGEPEHEGALTVFPIHASAGRTEYFSFAEASAWGFALKELDTPNVNTLIAVNPLDTPVLLFEGKEAKGAQQDRTFDTTILVAGNAQVRVPVSCVEHGRWDDARHNEAFTPSAHAAFPALRATKNTRARQAMAAGLEARADQGEVWEAVAQRVDRDDVATATGAMGDVFEHHRDELSRFEHAITRKDGQVGALVCIGGQPAVLDYVSRPDALAALWPALLRGYCLDAVGVGAPAGPAQHEEFLDSICTATVTRRPGVSLGDTVAFTKPTVGGVGLAVDAELVQLSAFPQVPEQTQVGRIRRPSRRG